MTASKLLPALPMLVAGTIASPALAATVTVTLPRLPVAEYHRPYVAGWIEPLAGGDARTVFVWYDIKKGGPNPAPGEGGTKWLSEMRTWWRKGGRSQKMPADGLSGATRAPGAYTIPLPVNLPAGQYVFKVEAARESGGRELVQVPFSIPAKGGTATGSSELGAVTIR